MDRAADIAYRADPGVERNNKAADTDLCRELKTPAPAVQAYSPMSRMVVEIRTRRPKLCILTRRVGRGFIVDFPGQTSTMKGFLMDRRTAFLLASGMLCAVNLLLGAGPASGTASHNPIGHVDSVCTTSSTRP